MLRNREMFLVTDLNGKTFAAAEQAGVGATLNSVAMPAPLASGLYVGHTPREAFALQGQWPCRLWRVQARKTARKFDGGALVESLVVIEELSVGEALGELASAFDRTLAQIASIDAARLVSVLARLDEEEASADEQLYERVSKARRKTLGRNHTDSFFIRRASDAAKAKANMPVLGDDAFAGMQVLRDLERWLENTTYAHMQALLYGGHLSADDRARLDARWRLLTGEGS